MVKLICRSCYRIISYLPKSLGKYRKLFIITGMLAILPVLVIGCTGNAGDKTQPEPYFPVQKQVEPVVLNLALQGNLVLDNGYLRVLGNLIIWSYGYSLKTEGREIWVINEKGQPVVRVGDEVRIGGGVIPGSWAEEKMGHPLPEGCEGPFWLAGGVVEKSDS
jgi:hypothetical protein